MWQGLLGKAATMVVTGAVGVAAYEVLRKAVAKTPVHEAAVAATALGLRGIRRAEESALPQGGRHPHHHNTIRRMNQTGLTKHQLDSEFRLRRL